MEGQIAPGPIKILLIEDEEFISELYKRAFTQAGYEVTVVRSGEDGLNEAKTNAYDIILLDIMIPDILGFNVLWQLRKDVPDLKAKVVIATNLEQDEQTRETIEKQADGYIIKADVTPKQLAAFLDQLL